MGVLNEIVVPKINAYWEDVAYALRYQIATVESIKSRNYQDSQRCCKELFRDWLTTKNGAAAGPKIWLTLLDKLRNVGELAAAREDIKKELVKMHNDSQV